MNIKIQGGSGQYANKSSCVAVVSYLCHEDIERIKEGVDIEPFFNNSNDKISSKEVTYMIDHNKGQLGRNDSKFFVISVSPSESELQAMGNTSIERSNALRDYVRNKVMQAYAENFNRNINKKDIMYYAKIHHDRGDKVGLNMHCHIIVSRKCIDNKLKLSPQTNHRKTNKGAVRGGFERKTFIQSCEDHFNKHFNYQRTKEETFEYCYTIKNGSIPEIQNQIIKSIQMETKREKIKEQQKNKSTKVEGGIEL